MEEEREAAPPSSPFWNHRRNPKSSFSTLKLWFLAVLGLLVFLLIFLYLPPLFSYFLRLLRPNHVRKTWDKLNLVLVIFAILCGFLGRNQNQNQTNDRAEHYTNTTPTAAAAAAAAAGSSEKSHSPPPIEKWFQQYGYSAYHPPIPEREETDAGIPRLQRSSSSYPDLREEVIRHRFGDDTELNTRRRSEKSSRVSRPNEKTERRKFDLEARALPPNSSTNHDPIQKSSTDQEINPIPKPKPSISPEESHDSMPKSSADRGDKGNPTRSEEFRASKMKSSSSYPDLRQEEEIWTTGGRRHFKDDSEVNTTRNRSDPRRHHRRRSHGEILVVDSGQKTAFVDNVIDQQQQQKRISQMDKYSKSESYVRDVQKLSTKRNPPPPPPPPPPPRRSDQKSKKRSRGAAKDIATAFTSLYNQKKIKKYSKHHINNNAAHPNVSYEGEASETAATAPPPPPPPPPPPSSVFRNWFSPKRSTKSKKANSAPTPPLPPRRVAELSKSGSGLGESYLSSGAQSPLVPVAPPPPPPFRMKGMKFKVRGDYVRIRSGELSDSEAGEISETEIGTESVSVFCPSPSVDTKADTFIARFRAGLKLEKQNSIKEKAKVAPNPSQIL